MSEKRNDTGITDFKSTVQYLAQSTDEHPCRIELALLATLASTLGQKYLVRSEEELITLGFNVACEHAPHHRICPLFKFATRPLAAYCGASADIQADLATAVKDLENLKGASRVNEELIDKAERELNYHCARWYGPRLLQSFRDDELLDVLKEPGGALYLSKRHVEVAEALDQLTRSERLGIPLLMNKTWEMQASRIQGKLALTLLHVLLSLNEPGLHYLLEESGLYTRFKAPPMLLLPKLKKSHLDLSREAVTYWERFIRSQAASYREGRFVIKYELKARKGLHQQLESMFERIDQHTHGSRVAWFPRLPHKFAALFSLIRGDVVIRLNDVEKACKLASYSLEIHLKMLDRFSAVKSGQTIKLSESEKLMLQKIQQRSPVPPRDLRRSFHRIAPDDFNADLDHLVKERLVLESQAGLVLSESAKDLIADMADR